MLQDSPSKLEESPSKLEESPSKLFESPLITDPPISSREIL